MNPNYELELVKALTGVLALSDVQSASKFHAENTLLRILQHWDTNSLAAYSGIIQ